MAELLKEDQRVKFPNGKQHDLLTNIEMKTTLNGAVLSSKLGISRRTYTDWKREKYLLPLKSVKFLLRLASLEFPKDVEIKKTFWWTQEAARIGGKIRYMKYGQIGDPLKRKKRWDEWWQRKGRYLSKGYFLEKDVLTPKKSIDLAEFCGIMLGDGSITPRQVGVTVHHIDDREFSMYIRKLMYHLFGVQPTWSNRVKRSTIFIVISRSKLVKFCQSIGLVIGNKIKQQIDIPKWIMDNVSFRLACVRGLMDTDGCIFNECHIINGKKYCYPRLSFVSMSKPLRESVYKILRELDFSPKIRNNRSVQLELKKDIQRYFELIRSSNPKHLGRLKNLLGGVG